MKRNPNISSFWSFVKSTGYPIKSVIQVSVDSRKQTLQRHFSDSNFYVFDRNASEAEVLNESYAGLNCEFFTSFLSTETGSKERAMHLNEKGVWQLSRSKNNKSNAETVDIQNVGEFVSSRKISTQSVLSILDYRDIEVVLGEKDKSQLSAFSFVSVSVGMSSFPTVIRVMSDAGFQVFDACSPCYYFEVLAKVDLVFINAKMLAFSLFNPHSLGGFDVEKWHEYSTN